MLELPQHLGPGGLVSLLWQWHQCLKCGHVQISHGARSEWLRPHGRWDTASSTELRHKLQQCPRPTARVVEWSQRVSTATQAPGVEHKWLAVQVWEMARHPGYWILRELCRSNSVAAFIQTFLTFSSGLGHHYQISRLLCLWASFTLDNTQPLKSQIWRIWCVWKLMPLALVLVGKYIVCLICLEWILKLGM